MLVHKFVCRGTVEEKIEELLAAKARLSRDVLESGAEIPLTEMSDDELLDGRRARSPPCGRRLTWHSDTAGSHALFRAAERRLRAGRALEKLNRKGQELAPIVIDGRRSPTTFWGEAWCENLERYSDFANRLAAAGATCAMDLSSICRSPQVS